MKIIDHITFTSLVESIHSATLGKQVPTTILAEPNTFKKLLCWYMNVLNYETLAKWTAYIPVPCGERHAFAPRLDGAYFACDASIAKGAILFRNDEHPDDQRLNEVLVVKEWI